MQYSCIASIDHSHSASLACCKRAGLPIPQVPGQHLSVTLLADSGYVSQDVQKTDCWINFAMTLRLVPRSKSGGMWFIVDTVLERRSGPHLLHRTDDDNDDDDEAVGLQQFEKNNNNTLYNYHFAILRPTYKGIVWNVALYAAADLDINMSKSKTIRSVCGCGGECVQRRNVGTCQLKKQRLTVTIKVAIWHQIWCQILVP